MRILIDLQGAQGDSRTRGMGRYALALALGIARNRGIHDVHIALSDLFPETIERIRGTIGRVLPQNKIHVWCGQPGVAMLDESSAVRRRNAEVQREAFLASLRPDMVVVASLFEGFGDDCVTSIKRYTTVPTAVVFYDLIPLIYKDAYLSDPVYASWYNEKLAQLKRADLCLAISKSSRLEGIDLLGVDPNRIIDIAAGTDSHFRPRLVSKPQKELLRERYGIRHDFLMYTGAFDWRKNIERLIRAYSRLNSSVREKHQLALVGTLHPNQQLKLEKLAQDAGLARDEVIVTGYVSDDDLLILYNACLAVVLPSLHEGFGLPVLEAMQCGKAVLAANTSSLPEVVGRRDALFDPRDDAAIAAALKRVIEDDGFRAELEQHGPKQAAKFSWDNTARRALAGIESAVEKPKWTKDRQRPRERKRLAYVSPLPPERSGISDYSAKLLPALRAFYEIDVIVDQPQVSGDWIEATGRPRGVEWFQEHFHRYDRFLYQLGNSPIHKHTVALIEKVPGVVVLHDFFLSELQARRGKRLFLRALKESHGYGAVMGYLSLSGGKVPANLAVIQSAQGVVVHSEKLREVASQWYGDGAGDEFEVIPYTYTLSNVTTDQREEARNRIGFPKDALLICSFGSLTPTSLNDRLISSFLSSRLVKEANTYLIFVGETAGAEFEQGLYRLISRSGVEERIRITGSASRETLGRYLKAADIAVQLNGDGAGGILDCMSHGVPTVISANEAIADIDRDGVWMLNCSFEDKELMEALETLAHDPALRKKIGAKAQDLIRTWHSPEGCAALYYDAIEKFHDRDANEVGGLMRKLSEAWFAESDTPILASTLSRNFPPRPRLRQLLVDVSELVHRDAKTGIQRVVRAILTHWLSNPPKGWLVEPVYASLERPGYRYARRFTCAFLEMDASWTDDEPVDAWSGDIFIGLDFQSHVIPAQHELLGRWYRGGVDIRFVVYDLLPILRPECFYDGAAESHANWLAFITRFNGAICISQSVARELRDWCDAHTEGRSVPFVIDWFHLGADFGMSVLSLGMTSDEERSLRCLRGVATFLMVGTVEPRKGHQQVLGAFEILWRRGIEANLIIVGKPGWKTEDFVERVKEHQELDKRVFWHKNATDEYLEQIYSASTSLIAASEGEGFGLPLIEAAQHGLPIIARDLPVFREVAGEYAFYFSGLQPEDLAAALTEWLKLYKAKNHIQSSEMNWLTWAQSSEMLLDRLGIGQSDRKYESPRSAEGKREERALRWELPAALTGLSIP